MKEAQTPSGSSLWLESISILWYMRRRGGSGWVVGGQMRLADCYSETWRCAGRKTRPAPRENLYTDKRGKTWRVCVCVRGRKYEERHGSQLLQRFIFWTPPTRHTLTDIVTEPSHLFKDDLKRDYKRGPDFSTVAPLLWWHKIESLPLSLSFSLSPSHGQIIKSAHRCSPEHSGRLNVRLLVLLVLWRLKCT